MANDAARLNPVILLPEEAAQIKAIHDAVAARNPLNRSLQGQLHMAIENSLCALHSVGTGGLQYAGQLGDAAKQVRQVSLKA